MSIGLKSDSSGTSGSIVINGSDKIVVTSAGNVTAGTFTGALTGSLTAGGSVTSGVQVASTSGTAIDFTGIPSWAKRVTVMLNGVSITGTSLMQVQIGSSSFSTSGYVSNVWTANVTNTSATTGFLISATNANTAVYHANILICTLGSNTWLESHSAGGVGGYNAIGGGSITLGGSLDRIRLTADGTQTFDAGTVNIMYEG